MSAELSPKNNDQTSLSPRQVSFIDRLELPTKVHIQTDSPFDTVTSNTESNEWQFIIGGERQVFNFFKITDYPMRKLAKYCVTLLINNGRALRRSDFDLIKIAFHYKPFTYDEFKRRLSTREQLAEPNQYYATKGLLRLLCQMDFPEFAMENLDDLILIPTPTSSNPFLKYQDLENAFPSPLKGLIARSIVYASKKRGNLSDTEIIDFTLFGLSFYTGMRPIQFSKLTVGDFKKDTYHKPSGLYRYSMNMPYAKKTKITIDRVKIALPTELGLLIEEYVKRANLRLSDRFIQIDEYLIRTLNETLQRVLFAIQSNEIKSKVENKEFILPRLTTYDFRHNVGHSLALAGASADEIAYMLGHSSLIAAAYYISATPELAMLKSKALGDNPVWQNMVNLLLTGYATDEAKWSKRTVSGTVGGQLHIKIGGCERPDEQCHLAKARSCYSCFYFRPFSNLSKHRAVLHCVNQELVDTLEVSEKSGNSKNPAINVLADLKAEVQMVINRIKGGVL